MINQVLVVFLDDNRESWCSHEECGTKEPKAFKETLVATLNTPILLWAYTQEGYCTFVKRCPEKD